MLEAFYTPRPPRVRASAATATLGRGSRRLRVGSQAGQDVDALLDLSSTGMKILTSMGPLEVGEQLDVELRHPEVRGPIALEGHVRWVEEGPGKTWDVGIRFERVRDTTAVALERLIGLELGSTVQSPRGQLGFVSPGAADASGTTRHFHVYGRYREELGIVAGMPGGTFTVSRSGKDPQPVERATFEEALRWVYQCGEESLRVRPLLP